MNVETQQTFKILGVVLESKLTSKEQLEKSIHRGFGLAESAQVHFKGRNDASLQGVCSPSPRIL